MHDVTAFRQIVERHQAGVFALLRNLGLDGHACEDVAQEAFLAAWEQRDRFDPRRGSFRAWLYAIARNRALNQMRKKRPLSLAAPPDVGWEAPATPRDDAAFATLDRALAALPMEQRAAFVLAEILGLSHGEVAVVERVPIGTVKSRVARAREKLRAAVGRPVEATS